jgi:uncharacterized glyoxalase superfamily protein PhnB
MDACIPYLSCESARQAIHWYCTVFEMVCVEYISDGATLVAHAELVHGEARFFVSSVYPSEQLHDARTYPSVATAIVLLCADFQPMLTRAFAGGANLVRPVVAGNNAKIRDPYGHIWILRQATLSGPS